MRLALKDKPNDDLLLKASVQLAADLSKKREREKALRAEKDISSDPLQMATEMMALSEAEIQRWQVVFAGLDKAKTGYITLPTLFVAIDEPDTDFARDIFTSVDALDRDNGEILEFPDFMKAISIYCMFGPMEIIK